MTLIRKFRGTSGQGLVEFALMLPVVLLLIIGTLDLGSAFFEKVVMENAAREGANYLVYNNTDVSRASNFAAVKSAVTGEAADSGITISVGDVEVQCLEGATVNNACPSGSTVVVRVERQYTLMFDILSGGPLTLANEARMLIP